MQVDAEGSEHRIRSGLRPGTYPVTATSHGRIVATAMLKVAAEDSAQLDRFVSVPRDAFPGSGTPASLRPGREVRVVLTDLRAAPGENSLRQTTSGTSRSPAARRARRPFLGGRRWRRGHGAGPRSRRSFHGAAPTFGPGRTLRAASNRHRDSLVTQAQ